MDQHQGTAFQQMEQRDFDTVGRLCGGTIDIDPQMKDFSSLNEAKGRVKATRATEVPQIVC